ncbi:MAG: RNA polymerase sigma-70 factor [Balneolaceae bacterium]|nr:RNA polymerase sigma-70 factor [Balneolaceae bacterium]
MSDNAFKNNRSAASIREDRKSELESLYRTFFADLCKYAFGFTGDREISRDIVQSVFIKIWDQKEFREGFEDAKSYLYKSVRNESLNYKKHEEVKRRTETDVQDRLKEWKKDREKTFNEEKNKVIREAIERLPNRCREIFKLSRDSGLTYKEIASVLGVSVKTVETQMGRAFKKIRTYVHKHWTHILLLAANISNVILI